MHLTSSLLANVNMQTDFFVKILQLYMMTTHSLSHLVSKLNKKDKNELTKSVHDINAMIRKNTVHTLFFIANWNMIRRHKNGTYYML